MQFQWAMHNYYSIVVRTITLHTIYVGALEKYSRLSNKYDEVVNRTLMGNRGNGGHGENHANVTIIFTTIRTSKSTYYLLYDKSPSKTQNNYIFPFLILLQVLASPTKK